MAVSLSTHVLDAGAGGPRPGIAVTVLDTAGVMVGSGATDATGRIAELATGLAPGTYRISWSTGGGFLAAVTTEVRLVEDRHYHLPLLVSDVSSVTYLGI